MCCHDSFMTGGTNCETPLGKGSWKLDWIPGLDFPFVDSALCPFAIISLSLEDDYALSLFVLLGHH